MLTEGKSQCSWLENGGAGELKRILHVVLILLFSFSFDISSSTRLLCSFFLFCDLVHYLLQCILPPFLL
jgi:hypothetical protein